MLAGYSFRPRAWSYAAAALACAVFIALAPGRPGARRRRRPRRATAERQRHRTFARVLGDAGQQAAHGRGLRGVTPLRLTAATCKSSSIAAGCQRRRPAMCCPKCVTPSGDIPRWRSRSASSQALNVERTNKAEAPNPRAAGFQRGNGLRCSLASSSSTRRSRTGCCASGRGRYSFEKHESYALQWYSFAALAVILALVFSFRKIENISEQAVSDRRGVRRAVLAGWILYLSHWLPATPATTELIPPRPLIRACARWCLRVKWCWSPSTPRPARPLRKEALLMRRPKGKGKEFERVRGAMGRDRCCRAAPRAAGRHRGHTHFSSEGSAFAGISEETRSSTSISSTVGT